jgi:hypothetical protein
MTKINQYILLILLLLLLFNLLSSDKIFVFHSYSEAVSCSSDLVVDYVAGSLALNNQSLYEQNFYQLYSQYCPYLGKGYKYFNSHPPTAAIFMIPLSLLNYKTAAIFYFWFSVFITLIISYLVIKGLRLPLLFIPITFIYMLTFNPVYSNLESGQLSIIVALFIISGWYFYKEDKNFSSLSISLATVLKIYPGILTLNFLFMKKKNALISCLAIIISLVAVSFIKTGILQWKIFFFRVVPEVVDYYQAYYGSTSLNGFLSRFFISDTPFVFNPTFKNLLYISISLALIFYIFYYKNNYDFDLNYSLFIVLSLILQPYGAIHYFIPVILIFFIILKRILIPFKAIKLLSLLIAMLLVSIATDSGIGSFVISGIRKYIFNIPPYTITKWDSFWLDGSLRFYGLIIFLVLLLKLIKESKKFKN